MDTTSAGQDPVDDGQRLQRSEAELRHARELLELGDAFFELDRDWRIVNVNRRQERLSKRPRAETLGRVFWELWPDTTGPGSQYWREYHRCMEERVDVEFEEYYEPLGLWTAVTAYPTSAGGIAVFFRDVTDRRRAEEQVLRLNESLRRRNAELDAERMRWQGVVEGIAEEVWLCDAEGRISLVNLPEATAMGLEPFENLTFEEAHREVEIFDADGRLRRPEDAPLIRAMRSGEVVRGEELMRQRRTGKARWRQYSCAPTRDASGSITGAVAITRDVTQNRETEQALRDADRRKDEFLAMLSHELRNPLAPIRNSLYVLDRVPSGSDPARRARATIARQVDHLTRLVGDLLDVSRITRGKIQLQLEPLDLREVVARTVDDLRPLFAEARIELELEQPAAAVPVHGDPTRLAQALGNVLQNAAKFTPPGGRVDVHLESGEGSAVLTVRDTGVGIAPDDLARVFEPFAQADRSLDRTSGGLGLGLALVRGLVELHGGEIHGHSSGPGDGAEFTIRLPMEKVLPGPKPDRETHARAARRRVLVIEDNVDAAESLRDALQLSGHEVEIACSGPEGLARARAHPPDVALCDIGLPGMDGYEVARLFRADERLRDIPLAAVTGYAAPEEQRRARTAGFDHHLAKPPDIGALERILASVRERRTR